MPYYRGVDIFGLSVQMVVADEPRDIQENAFFGINNVEALDGGARGRNTLVKGILFGLGGSGLAFAENTFRSFKDGQTGLLIDNLGNTWQNVRLEHFQPTGRAYQDGDGYVFRDYEARFRHLSDV